MPVCLLNIMKILTIGTEQIEESVFENNKWNKLQFGWLPT